MFQLIIRWLFMGCGYITHFYCKIRNYSIITIVLPLIVIMSNRHAYSVYTVYMHYYSCFTGY